MWNFNNPSFILRYGIRNINYDKQNLKENDSVHFMIYLRKKPHYFKFKISNEYEVHGKKLVLCDYRYILWKSK